ncbi:MAG: hydroxymyristoyl-ACP dehydratase [Bacteroidales bacterium]|nr:hydroxymyristoyl-ACP dehydratase [Bacteroidales bacterium]
MLSLPANQKEVLELIPQKPPMLMVDALIMSTPEKTVSQLQLHAGNIFCQAGLFREPGIIENIAQTAALGNGFAARQSGHQPKTGFIGAIKRLTIFELPKDTDTLQTTVTVLHEMLNATVIKGEVFVDKKIIAEGEMNIFLQPTA